MKIEFTEKKIIGIAVFLIILTIMFTCHFGIMDKQEVMKHVYGCIKECLINGGNIDGLCLMDCLE